MNYGQYESLQNVKDCYLQNNSFNNKIALLNKLSSVEIEFDSARFTFDNSCSTSTENLYYIYNDHMLIVDWNNKKEIIPEYINYLNILYITDKHLELINNLPNNIEYLHISCMDYNFLKKLQIYQLH